MAGEEMLTLTDIKVEVTPSAQAQPEDVTEVMSFLEKGYGARWQGEENFKNSILANSTEILRIYSGDILGASLTFDNDRITAIAVNPDLRGQGLGVRLFEEAAKVHPNVWISAGVDAQEMMATLTSSQLSFMPVGDKDKIEQMYKATNQGGQGDNYKIEVKTQPVPFLTQRLKEKKGADQAEFLTYIRPGGTHKGSYYQVMFQNNPTV